MLVVLASALLLGTCFIGAVVGILEGCLED